MLNSDLMSDPLEHCSQCLMDLNLAQYSFNKGLMILHSKNVGIEKSSTRDSQSSTRDAQSSTRASFHSSRFAPSVPLSTRGGLSISRGGLRISRGGFFNTHIFGLEDHQSFIERVLSQIHIHQALGTMFKGI